jgi:uncharacterized membrane protein YqjE
MVKIIMIFAIAAVLGVGLAILFNKFAIKDYPEKGRKTKYAITIVVFLLIALALGGVLLAKSATNTAIQEKSTELEQYIKDSHPNNGLVKNGLDLTGINNDASRINNVVKELKSLLPTSTELGVPKQLYDIAADYAMKELQKKLIIFNFANKQLNSLADEDGLLTVSSVIKTLRTNIIKLVNIVFLIIAAILVVVFLIYIISSLVTAGKERKSRKALETANSAA